MVGRSGGVGGADGGGVCVSSAAPARSLACRSCNLPLLAGGEWRRGVWNVVPVITARVELQCALCVAYHAQGHLRAPVVGGGIGLGKRTVPAHPRLLLSTSRGTFRCAKWHCQPCLPLSRFG